MKKILITGSHGQVGWELRKSLAILGKIFAFDKNQFDLTNPKAMLDCLDEIKPDVIVNPAAYTAVDKAETDRDQAFLINSQAPLFLAEQAKKRQALLIHYSTDYVFDGTSPRPYHEEDITNPLNTYGQSKLDGEKNIAAIDPHFFIFRTSWVYGLRGKNFLLTILRLAKEKEALNIIDDQLGAPTWSKTIADVTAKAIYTYFQNPANAPKGIYHLTNAGQTSWHGFSKAIIDQYQKLSPSSLKVQQINPIEIKDYPTPAKRPANSSLNLTKLEKQFGLNIPPWDEALKHCLEGYLIA